MIKIYGDIMEAPTGGLQVGGMLVSAGSQRKDRNEPAQCDNYLGNGTESEQIGTNV